MNHTSRYVRAQLLLQQQRPKEAEDQLRQGLAEAPNDPLGHALLASCLLAQDKPVPATEEAERSIHLAPAFPFSHYTLARAYYARNREREALAAIQEAIRLDPEDDSFYAVLGRIKADQKKWTEALAAAEQGLLVDPESAACANLKAMVLQQLGRREEAEMSIASTLQRNPEDAAAHTNRGWNCLHQGQPKQALEHFSEALRLNPHKGKAKSGLVEALKARHFIYRIFLAYLLWMTRLSNGAQWGIVIGGYIGYRLLAGFARDNPAVAPFVLPLIVLYFGFVLMTWLAQPLFNLLLRFNKYGKHALTPDQRMQSNFVGALLTLALVLVAIGIGRGDWWILVAAAFTALLSFLTAAIFNCERGWPRNAMIGYTLLLAVASIVYLSTIFVVDVEILDPWTSTIVTISYGFGIAFLAGQFLASWLMMQTVRK